MRVLVFLCREHISKRVACFFTLFNSNLVRERTLRSHSVYPLYVDFLLIVANSDSAVDDVIDTFLNFNVFAVWSKKR